MHKQTYQNPQTRHLLPDGPGMGSGLRPKAVRPAGRIAFTFETGATGRLSGVAAASTAKAPAGVGGSVRCCGRCSLSGSRIGRDPTPTNPGECPRIDERPPPPALPLPENHYLPYFWEAARRPDESPARRYLAVRFVWPPEGIGPDFAAIPPGDRKSEALRGSPSPPFRRDWTTATRHGKLDLIYRGCWAVFSGGRKNPFVG